MTEGLIEPVNPEILELLSTMANEVLLLKAEVSDLKQELEDATALVGEHENWIQGFNVSEYLIEGRGIEIKDNGDGQTEIGSWRGWKGMFELYDILGDNTYKIRNVGNSAYIGPISVGVSVGAGFSAVSNYFLGDAISAATDVWMEIDRKNSLATIIAGTLPNGLAAKYDYTDIVPLYNLAWDTPESKIDLDSTSDKRHASRIPIMA